jgi:hypothetical protein
MSPKLKGLPPDIVLFFLFLFSENYGIGEEMKGQIKQLQEPA